MNVRKERIAFQDREEDALAEAADQSIRKGVKVSNNKSKYSKQAAEKQQFATSADNAISNDLDRKTRAVTLVNKFWQVSQNKALIENKGPFEASVEAQLVKELIGFANELNSDENEIEGAGSVAIIALLLKSILKFRDANNTLAYKIQLLENKVAALQAGSQQSK